QRSRPMPHLSSRATVSARLPSLALAFACLASIGLSTPANAGTILQYEQTNPADFVTATNNGVGPNATTTLTTNSVTAPGSIPVTIVNALGVPVNVAAFETFIGVHSTDQAVNAAGVITQHFSGTIAVTTGANNTGANILTAVFTGFSGPFGALSRGFLGAPPS